MKRYDYRFFRWEPQFCKAFTLEAWLVKAILFTKHSVPECVLSMSTISIKWHRRKKVICIPQEILKTHTGLVHHCDSKSKSINTPLSNRKIRSQQRFQKLVCNENLYPVVKVGLGSSSYCTVPASYFIQACLIVCLSAFQVKLDVELAHQLVETFLKNGRVQIQSVFKSI